MALDVVIVGAGIAGLTSSIALRRAGHKVLILEKDASKRETGFAVSIPPNSSRVLLGLGVDFTKARMTPWNGLDLIKCDENPIRWIPTQDVDTEKLYGAPFVCAHRVDLHNCLYETAIAKGKGIPVEVRGGTTVSSYNPAGSVILENGECIHADLIIAADGVRSRAHKWILGQEQPARPSKLSSLRFVVPTAELLENGKTKELFAKGSQRAAVYFSSTQKEGVFRSPCRDNTLQNFGIYDIKERGTDAENWITPASKSMAFEILKYFDDSILEIVRLADEKEMFLWRVADRDPLVKFQHQRLVILGDACHPMQPHHGQGASQAIEDAGVLGVLMTGVSDVVEIPKRLNLWEQLRKPRVDVVQLLSRSEGMDLILTEETSRSIRKLISEDDLPYLTRAAAFHWFFNYDCLAEAQRAVLLPFH